MTTFLTAFSKLMILALLILTGFVAKRKNMLQDSFSNNTVDFVIKFALPLMVFTSFQQEFSKEIILRGGKVFLLASAVFTMNYFLSILSGIIFRIPQDKKGMWQFGGMMSNVLFMGMPVIVSLYGEEGIFYVAMVNLSSSLYTYILGVWIVAKNGSGSGGNLKMKELLCTPINFALVMGLLFFVFQITLPVFIADAFDYITDTIVPLAMVYVGTILAKNSFKEMVGDWHVYALCAMRLVVLPLITFAVMRFFVSEKMMLACLVLSAAAMPVPTTSVLFVGKYGGDIKYASRCAFMSTIICAITIPFISMLFV